MTVNERLKFLRKELNIKQGDFAEKISTTQGHISDIENGRKNLFERTLKLICLEDWDGKTVNETWLRAGEGEIFIEQLKTLINTLHELSKSLSLLTKYDWVVVLKLINDLSERNEVK